VKPEGQLDPQPWMTAPATREVVAALTRHGQTVRFVGGCVRDALLGRPVRDIDIATPDPPDAVIELLEAAGLKAVPTGIVHGTITAVAEGRPFEVTTLRRDVETFGRHARVAFTDDWAADAARRDFTMNALFLNPYGSLHGLEDGAIFDPVGGLGDARAGRVRFVGDAELRIAEDHLRILRFFRFHAHYGRGAADAIALAACAKHAPSLTQLSGERVRNELLKLLAAPAPADAVELMRAAGVLAVILPEAGSSATLAALARLEMERGADDALRRLAALLAGPGQSALAVAERLKLSNADRDRLAAMTEPLPAGLDLSPDAGVASHRRALQHVGAARARDRALLAWARMRADGRGAEPGYGALLALIGAWKPAVFPLKGADVLALGARPGAPVGTLLAAVESWWERGDYRADRTACLAELKRRLAAS
jgi:poly(A) polymerase